MTVTDRNGEVKPDIDITLKDRNGNEEKGVTNKNGQLILPDISVEHCAYIIGYEDGTFRPEGNITRAEAAAIFARNIAELKGEAISGRTSSFSDVDSGKWYTSYIAYLEKYGVINGYEDNTFRPDTEITRAEVVTIVNRVTERNADEDYINENLSNLLTFSDMKDKGYWGWEAIMEAANTHDALIFDDVENWTE